MFTRHPPSVERRPETGHPIDGVGTPQDLFGVADTGSSGVSQGFLGERRHRRQLSGNSHLAGLDPRLQPPQLTNRGLEHDPIGTAGIDRRHPLDQLMHRNQLHQPSMTRGCNTVLRVRCVAGCRVSAAGDDGVGDVAWRAVDSVQLHRRQVVRTGREGHDAVHLCLQQHVVARLRYRRGDRDRAVRLKNDVHPEIHSARHGAGRVDAYRAERSMEVVGTRPVIGRRAELAIALAVARWDERVRARPATSPRAGAGSAAASW